MLKSKTPDPEGRSPGKGDPPGNWKADVRNGVRHVEDLAVLPLSEDELESARDVSRHHKVRIPRAYLDLIDWNNPDDPIRRQVVPSAEELTFDDGELEDPIGDSARSPVPRLTHRYPDRVLLFPTYLCAVYCRYCFRKESLTTVGRGYSRDALEQAFDYIEAHDEVREVILTGGDPFSVGDKDLRELRERIEAIPHIRLLRIHTRVPVALPSRITDGLVEALKGRLTVCVVTHFNHPREITDESEVGCRRLREAGFILLNQSVLLKGVNNDAHVLRELFTELVYRLGVKPYYLHHCDLVRGMTHMRTTIEEGFAIMRQLRGYISGLCNPVYVLDLPGGAGKIPLGPSYIESREGDDWAFRTYDGKLHRYREIVEQDCEGSHDRQNL